MYQYKGRIISVVDGDSAYCAVDLGFETGIQKLELRFSSINAPEHGTPGYQAAKDRVIKWFAENPEFLINTEKDKQEKWRRYLATFLPLSGVGPSLNELLVAEGLAKPYTGKGPKPA